MATTQTLTRFLHCMVENQLLRQLSDEDLLGRFISGHDQAAFQAILCRHGTMVFDVCRNLVGNQEDAEDAFQATFLVLARKPEAVRKKSSVGSWLHGVALRIAMKARARAAKRDLCKPPSPVTTPTNPSDNLTWREIRQVLHAELAQISHRHRSPIVLCYLEGKTQDEAARMLGVSRSTLKKDLERARALLRVRLVKRGLGPSAILLFFAWPAAKSSALAPRLISSILHSVNRMGGDPSVVSAQVAELADMLRFTQFNATIKCVCSASLVVCVLALGVGAAGLHSTSKDHPAVQAEIGQSPADSGPEAAEPAKRKEIADGYGDLLPEGAVLRLGTVRLRHGGPVCATAFSPDGKLAATSGSYGDNIICLWETGTAREVARLDGHKDQVMGFVFTADGKTIFSCGQDMFLRRWDVSTRKEVQRLKIEEKWLAHMAFTQDGKNLATIGSADPKAIRLWDSSTGKVRRVFQGEGQLQGIAFSPDGTKLCASTQDKKVRIWDASTGKKTDTINVDHLANMLAFSPGGKTLAIAGDGGDVQLWELGNEKQVVSFAAESPVACLSFSPDGQAIAVGMDRKPVTVLDVATGNSLRSFEGSTVGVRSLTFAPDGRTLLTGSKDHTARLLDVATGKDLFPFKAHHGYVGNVSFSSDGKVIQTCGIDQTVANWDLAGKNLLSFQAGHSRVRATAFSPDHRQLACTGARLFIRLYDPTTGRLASRVGTLNATGMALAWSGDGRLIAAGCSNGDITVWDAKQDKLVRELSVIGDPDLFADTACILALSPDGKYLAASGADQPVHIWDVSSGEEIHQLVSNEKQVISLAFSPDTKTLAVGGQAGAIALWNIQDGRQVGQLGSPGWVQALLFSRDGRTLVSGGPNNAVHLWEMATFKERLRFEGHRGAVISLAFSPDGCSLVSGSSDSSALVWDLTQSRTKAIAPAEPSEEVKCAWADLADEDAAKAYRAMWFLSRQPDHALPLLRQTLQPATSKRLELVKELIVQLDSEKFTTRQKAMGELAKMGAVIDSSVRRALADRPTLEQRSRLQGLLQQGQPIILPPNRRREARALELLEHLGTDEARQFLQSLAEGTSGAWPTNEAVAAMWRNKR